MSLTIAHLSDLHLGYSTGTKRTPEGVNIREMDGYIAFRSEVSDIIDDGTVDVAIVAGDGFHSPSPSIRAILEFQDGLRRLSDAGIKCYVIAGNHDVRDIRSDIAASKVVDDPMRNIHSHVEPYVKYEIGDGVFLHMVSHHMYSEQGATLKKVIPVSGGINILTTHGSVIDPLLELTLRTEASPREIVIPDSVLYRGWDYIMLGHIHERGWVHANKGAESEYGNIYYNGSLIRRGFSDGVTEHGRGWTKWTITDDGEFIAETKQVAQRPQYDLSPVDAGTMNSSEITEKIVESLKQTQLDGVEFHQETAPILRQKLLNLTPSKRSGIDWAEIKDNSGHALSWDVQTTFADTTEKDSEKRAKSADHKDGGDMVSTYDNWVKSTNHLDRVDEDLRTKVEKDTRTFVKLGQEKIYEKE